MKQFGTDTITRGTLISEKMDSLAPEYNYISHKDVANEIMQFAGKQRVQLMITGVEELFSESLFHRSLTKKLAFHTHTPFLLLKDAI